ncbi:type ISP restriction/modification enzyme [Flavobacterium sp. 5]|uniref:type ISP restriction/modification enzyme n=1 Tax=Flavobacterium sp. 5 TaxID=2035199 RepID=UPI0012FD927A
MSALNNKEIVQKITNNLDLAFFNQKELSGNVCFANDNDVRPEFKEIFSQIDLLNYIYAILFLSKYRENHQEFLKSNFSYIPIPNDKIKFWKLIKLGNELRENHLFKNNITEHYNIQYPIHGDNIVENTLFKNSFSLKDSHKNIGKIYINKNQYFDNVPEVAWNFYIGIDQPAQKWLKEREYNKLNQEDILYYQKMILILLETIRIVKEIDIIEF